MPSPAATRRTSRHVDVLVVGAGISGVGAGWHLQHNLPGKTYAILEARNAVGGTWDLFRFPGVRSDSDMFTLGYPFRPWTRPEAIGDGPAIRSYIHETAKAYGIDKAIHFGTRVRRAAWSSREARWTVEAVTGGGRSQTWTCDFLYGCTGYYDYAGGYQPDWPGLADYGGRLVHPQNWPEDLDLSGKRVLVIGSGATAVTLVPALADAGADVTMLQRSPSWVMTVGRRDPLAPLAERLSPAAAYSLLRTRNALLAIGIFSLARHRPQLARRLLRRAMAAIVGPQAVAEHFTPAYDPWTQRLCIAPEGDFLHALADGRARIVTDRIDRFVSDGVRLASGRVLEADVVVSATGLVLQPWGGVTLSVDDEDVDLGSCVVYRGCMLSGVPNLGFCVGYINAAWTLRVELSHAFLCKVLAYLDEQGLASATPVPPAGMHTRPVLDLTSGYVLRGADGFPKQGDREPWLMPQNWFLDRRLMARARVEQDMVFTRRKAPSVVQVTARQAS